MSQSLYRLRATADGSEVPFHEAHFTLCLRMFHDLFGTSPDQFPIPTLYLFDSFYSFKEHLRSTGREIAPLARFSGLFWIEADGPALGTTLRDFGRFERCKTLQHEAFHYFETMQFGSAMPSWLSEGAAQIYEETLFIDGALVTGRLPPSQFEPLQILQKSRALMPLTKLRFISQEEIERWSRLDAGESNRFYAQSWALAQFLVSKFPKFSPVDFARRTSLGDEHPLFVLGEMTGLELSTFEESWHQWIAQLRPDPVSQAIDRLDLISGWMIYLSDKLNISNLPNLHKLRFAANQFPWVRAISRGRQHPPLSTPSLYQYHPAADAPARDFEILPPAQDGVPPTLRASGLDALQGGSLELIWDANAAGQLIPDFRFAMGPIQSSE